jgi:hypothetical protein
MNYWSINFYLEDTMLGIRVVVSIVVKKMMTAYHSLWVMQS